MDPADHTRNHIEHFLMSSQHTTPASTSINYSTSSSTRVTYYALQLALQTADLAKQLKRESTHSHTNVSTRMGETSYTDTIFINYHRLRNISMQFLKLCQDVDEYAQQRTLYHIQQIDDTTQQELLYKQFNEFPSMIDTIMLQVQVNKQINSNQSLPTGSMNNAPHTPLSLSSTPLPANKRNHTTDQNNVSSPPHKQSNHVNNKRRKSATTR